MPSIWLRLWRFSALAAAVLLIRAASPAPDAPEPLTLEEAREWFPAAARVSPPDGEAGAQYVTDSFGDVLGLLLQTLPASRDIIGYSGPSNTLLVLDRNRAIIGARLLSSGDTVDHVRRVVEDAAYWERLRDVPGATGPIQGVSGATLTSTAITRGAMRALGLSERASLLFPYPLELVEIRDLFPDAASFAADPGERGGVLVRDSQGSLIGRVLRTSPASDPVIGYKGPTDTLVALDPEGTVIRELRVRDSYETEEYLATVTADSRFLPGFSGRSVASMREFDSQREGISGVSGATRTSLAILEGVRRRLAEAGHVRVEEDRFGPRDVLLAAIVAMGAVLAFTSWRGVTWVRWTWQAVLIGYLGLTAGDMVSQALLAGWAAHGVPWRQLPGLALLTAAALLVPLFTGKQLYCHHLCPHGAAQQWLGKLTRRKIPVPEAVTRHLARVPPLLLGLIFLLVTSGVTVNLAAFEPFDAWIFRVAGLASIVIALLGLLASIFYPLAYCKFGCPTGALLKFLRTGGSETGFGPRDRFALGLLLAGAALVLG